MIWSITVFLSLITNCFEVSRVQTKYVIDLVFRQYLSQYKSFKFQEVTSWKEVLILFINKHT